MIALMVLGSVVFAWCAPLFRPNRDRQLVRAICKCISTASRLEVIYVDRRTRPNRIEFFVVDDRLSLRELARKDNWPSDARFYRIVPAPGGKGVKGLEEESFNVLIRVGPSDRVLLVVNGDSELLVDDQCARVDCGRLSKVLHDLYRGAKNKGAFRRIETIEDVFSLVRDGWSP